MRAELLSQLAETRSHRFYFVVSRTFELANPSNRAVNNPPSFLRISHRLSDHAFIPQHAFRMPPQANPASHSLLAFTRSSPSSRESSRKLRLPTQLASSHSVLCPGGDVQSRSATWDSVGHFAAHGILTYALFCGAGGWTGGCVLVAIDCAC